MKIDVFNNILPKKYLEKIVNVGPGGKNKDLEKPNSNIPFLKEGGWQRGSDPLESVNKPRLILTRSFALPSNFEG